MDPFIESLRHQRSRLQAEIAEMHQRLKLIDQLLASYDPASSTPGPEPEPKPQPRARMTNGHARPESKRAKVRQTVADLLGREGELHRAKILDHLVSVGIMGQEKDPMGQLAAYLTENRDLFESDGLGKFKLREG